MLAGLALRVAWILTVDTELVRIVDMQWYYVTASNLAAGRGLTVDVIPGMGYVANDSGFEAVLWPPGYPLTLAVFFKWFGTSLASAKALNLIASTATIIATYFLARSVFDVRTALLAAALCAIYPANIIWSSVLYSDVVFTAPFAFALAVLARSWRRPTIAMAIIIGLLVGYSTIIRPPGAILLAVAAIVWVSESGPQKAARPLAAAVLAAVSVAAPVAIWNTVRTDSVMLLSQNMGYNMRIGHAPYATGRYITPPAEDDRRILFSPDHRSDWSFVREAIFYAVTHPRREVELTAKKVFYLYTTDSDSVIWATSGARHASWGSMAATQRLQDVTDAVSYMTIVLAIASIPVAFSLRGGRSVLWLTLLLWTLTHIVFFGEPRYRLPILPILLTLGAMSLMWLWDGLRGERNASSTAEFVS